MPELGPDSKITAMVLSFNEEPNIERTLRSIAWVDEILVVDSGSTDATLEIVAQFSNVRVISNPFSSFADQCNFGLQQIETEWVLSIDADYLFPVEAESAIRKVMGTSVSGYSVPFDYAVFGKVVRGSILPPRTVLYQKSKAQYENDGHGHRVKIDGRVEPLEFKIVHDDRKSLKRWLGSQIGYAQIEAEKISNSPSAQLSLQDKIRKCILIAPLLVFLLTYVFRGGFLSGRHGFYYALQRFYAEVLLSVCLVDRKLNDQFGKNEP